MFDHVPVVPSDPIFSLVDQFREDPHPEKVNLTVGVYQDESGQTPVMTCVKEAEKRLLIAETTKSYLSISGLATFNTACAKLILGEDSPVFCEERFGTLQTPGGTGALRVLGQFLSQQDGNSHLWIGDPTWANHHNIFKQAGVPTKRYRYLAPSLTELDFESLMEALNQADEGDAFLFHGCCHNPSGIDLEVDQWEIVFGFLRERNLLAIFDLAYQGFGESLDDDVLAIRRLAELGGEFVICSSHSKNVGLYGERIGALTFVTESAEKAQKAKAYTESLIRAMYSNPPRHGASVVATILQDDELQAMWRNELAEMKDRVKHMRQQFAEQMRTLTGTDRFDFITRQRGMFGFLGIEADQVAHLKKAHSIYALQSSRINVAGLNPTNLPRVCQAICEVVSESVGASMDKP